MKKSKRSTQSARSRQSTQRKRSARRLSRARKSNRLYPSKMESKNLIGGKSNRYIEPQLHPKSRNVGFVAKGKDKQFWQIVQAGDNVIWAKPKGMSQMDLKKIYYQQLQKEKEELLYNSEKNNSKKRSSRKTLSKSQ